MLARFAGVLCVAGCSAYDSSLLVSPSPAAAPRITAAACDGDTCGGCGDMILQPGETCDPPETCLTSKTCLAPSACAVARLSGSAKSCDVVCEIRVLTQCESDDGCCPEGCAPSNDDDCPDGCGNGVVDSDETCEPDSKTAPCDVICDDGDECTRDRIVGSPDNCNVDCMFVPITDPVSEDGCCPPGATFQSDSDCSPRCGNGVLEPGEECDGQDDCDSDCHHQPGMQADGCNASLMEISGLSDACRSCVCGNCSEEAAGCLRTGDPQRDLKCRTTIECTQRTGCRKGACFCGSSPGCVTPNGVCRTEIAAAAISADPGREGANCSREPDCPANRAAVYDNCVDTNCEDVCGNNTSPTRR